MELGWSRRYPSVKIHGPLLSVTIPNSTKQGHNDMMVRIHCSFPIPTCRDLTTTTCLQEFVGQRSRVTFQCGSHGDHVCLVVRTNVVSLSSGHLILGEVCIHLITVKVSVVALAVGVVEPQCLLTREHPCLHVHTCISDVTSTCCNGNQRSGVQRMPLAGYVIALCLLSRVAM